jgi:arylsulfatase A-like enzyme
VLIISFDGLRPDAIALAPMPNFQTLMETGAYTLTGRTIFPSVTLPAHASMLTGQCPAQTGVDWNDFIPKNGYARGVSIFALAKKAGLATVMVVGKRKLSQITPPENLDAYKFINDRDVVVAEEAAPLLQADFGLAFIHFATIDDMGHVYGWLSWQQLSVARRADEALGALLAALDAAGLRESTLIILNADHGGDGLLHSARQPENYTIPWVVSGPGVRPQTITAPVSVMDTAATAAWALGLTPPAEWAGRPILEAFGQNSPARAEPRCP